MRRLLWVGALAGALSGRQAMFRGDAVHSGRYPSAGPREFHRIKWRFATGGRLISSPVWLDGVLYFGSNDNNLYSVDATSGKQNWKFATRGPVPSTPAVSGGLIYFGSYDGYFYAVDAREGHLRWKFRTEGERRFEAKGIHGFQPKTQTIPDPFDLFLSSPVVADGAVYFGSGDGNVYALDAATGALRWKFATGDVIHASPAFYAGSLYVGSWDSNFYAIDAATGKEKWRFHGGEDPVVHNQVGFQSSPTIAAGTVYTGCRDSNLYALDAATGKEKWRFFNDGSWVIVSPAVDGGKIVFATSDSSLFYVADTATGKPLVKQGTGAYVFSSPALAGGIAYYGVFNGTLQARDMSDGKLLWEFQTETAKENANWELSAEGKVNSSFLFRSTWLDAPVVASDIQFDNGIILSSPLVVNHVVYFGSTDGYLYAVE
jgi:eukaryotic-like serine/threonine-protein kinase